MSKFSRSRLRRSRNRFILVGKRVENMPFSRALFCCVLVSCTFSHFDNISRYFADVGRKMLKFSRSRLRRSRTRFILVGERVENVPFSRALFSSILAFMNVLPFWERHGTLQTPGVKVSKFSRSPCRRSKTKSGFGRDSRRKRVIFYCDVLPRFCLRAGFLQFENELRFFGDVRRENVHIFSLAPNTPKTYHLHSFPAFWPTCHSCLQHSRTRI